MEKILLSLILLGVLDSCSGVNHPFDNKTSTEESFKKEEVEISIKEIDSLSLDLYYMIKFYRKKNLKEGILLVFKTDNHKFMIGKNIKVKLCDIKEYKSLSIKKESVDTLTSRGHFMINGTIYYDEKLILDFSDDAKKLVFQLCD